MCVAGWPTGLSQYSGDPRTEWQLNNFTSKEQLLEAVRNFRYKGGNTFTGKPPHRPLLVDSRIALNKPMT